MDVPMMKVSALWDKFLSEYVLAESDRLHAAQRVQDTLKPDSERSDYQRERDCENAQQQQHFHRGQLAAVRRLAEAFGLDVEKLTAQALDQIEKKQEGYTHAERIRDFGSMDHLS